MTTYYLTSSALAGAIIEELSSTGQKNVGYVYAGGQLLAKQSANQVTWKHPHAGWHQRVSYLQRQLEFGQNEFDPLGADLALQYSPPPENPEGQGDISAGHFGGIMDARLSDFFNFSSGCAKEGVAASCHQVMDSVNGFARSSGPGEGTAVRASSVSRGAGSAMSNTFKVSGGGPIVDLVTE